MNSKYAPPSASYIHYLKRSKGHWKYLLLNLFLRVAVKWRQGLVVDVGKVRRHIDKLNQSAPKQIAGIERRAVQCNGVPGDWLIPRHHRENRVVLYIHGGAFVAYSQDIYANMVAGWCHKLQSRALLVDYRLSPEHRYPAASDDCLCAYRWLLDQGFNASDIVVAGDSAGGNLLLGTLLRLKDKGLPMPACAVLLSPFLDLTLSGPSALTNARRDPIFTLPFAIDIRSHYARPEQLCDPGVSPVLGDFNGLPPMLFQASSTEMIRDDSVSAAKKAKKHGIPVQLDIWEALPHVFQTIEALPQAKVAADRIAQFIQKHTRWD